MLIRCSFPSEIVNLGRVSEQCLVLWTQKKSIHYCYLGISNEC